MNNKRILCLAILLLATMSMAFADIRWYTTTTQADKALETGKQRFWVYDFSVDWCGWCTKLDRDTWSDSTVQTKLAGFLCMKLNPENESAAQSLGERLGLEGYPFIYLYDSLSKQGTVIDGYVGPAEMARRIDAFKASCPTQATITWETDIQKALSRAKAEKKLLMIDVFVDWCGWCKKLDNEVYSDATVAAQTAGYICVKINPETNYQGAKFLANFNITGYPTILFVTGNGSYVDSIVGFVQPAKMVDQLKNLASQKWY